MPSQRARTGSLALISIGWLLIAACQKQEAAAPAPPPPPPPPPAAPAAATDGATVGADAAAAAHDGAAPAAAVKAGTGTITGKAIFVGKPPEMQMIKRQADPFCARTPMKEEEAMIDAAGGVKNVLVRITQGISGNYEPPMTNATLDQSACMYRPRVQGIMAGQSLLVRNSDQTLHNVHAYRGPSTIFNQAEIPGLPPMAKKFNDTGSIIKFKCDVHPWMTAYVAISNHPFFAVTGDDGSFSIPKVPAGKYTVEAWHERFGTKTTELTVVTDSPANVTFQFGGK